MKTIKKTAGAAALLALVLAGSGARAQAAGWPARSNGEDYITCVLGDEEHWRVKMLQYLLRAQGYTAATDGSFGHQTQAALRLFQKRCGLRVTGQAGDAEWKALAPTLRRGSQGNAVRALQVGINHFIHEHTDESTRPMPIDGKFGALTEKWLRQVQNSHDGGPSDVADGFTWFDLLYDEH